MNTLLAQLGSIRSGSLTPVFGLLIDTALKGSLLILAAAIAVYLLRGRSAAARHAAWSAAVVGHLALPILTLLVPQWRIPLLPAPPWLDTPAPVSAPQLNNQAAQIILSSEPPETAAPAASAPSIDLGTSASPNTPSAVDRGSASSTIKSAVKKWPLVSTFGLLWIVGTMLVLLRLAIGTWRVGRLAKNGDRVDDGEWLSLTQRIAKGLGITRPLTLLRGNSLAVPVTWGVVYPAVLLPPDAGDWPEARRRFVLVHEMAHVKRFDALTQLVAQITIAILWFDPLIWIAAHRMRVEREHACDDYVLRDGTTPSLYAGELLEMVQSIGSPRHDSAAPAFAALAMARRSEFEGRMLAILDPRQNRHTLGRTSAIIASVALALLVLPLAALRPFETNAVRPASIVASTATPASNAPKTAAPGDYERHISDIACDSVMRLKGQTNSTHIHVDVPDDGSGHLILEYLATAPGHCSQAAVIGASTFANDRLIALAPASLASFREMTSSGDRVVRVLPGNGSALEYISSLNGKRVEYDDDMRTWLGRFVPEVLREAGVDAAPRVARDMARGGVSLVLANIGRTKSTASKRLHYDALLDGRPLTDAEYAQIRTHAARNLSGSSSDLNAVLTRIGAGPAAGTKGLKAAVTRLMLSQEAMGEALGIALDKNKSSSESANTMTQYASTDDPEMVLLALQGAKEISSDTDRRLLLQTLAPRALRRKSTVLRKAYFAAVAEMTSDTDRRIVLQSALPYGHADSAVTLAVFKSVADMSSDTDRRLVLQTAAEQRLLATSEIRNAFMIAAKTITNSTDYTLVVQSALKQ
ncbi:MAG: M56 family metallopeptidase [Gemmatimonadales bacterium]